MCNRVAHLLHALRTWAGVGATTPGSRAAAAPSGTELLREVCNLLECLGHNLASGLKHVLHPLLDLLDIEYVGVADKKVVLKAVRRALAHLPIR